ncbi:hypothetical protein MKZ38_005816 [Zalerion maritima]|uniref:Uncharacterized protein n=1 Tax=Zalerion maritima TaxID=339359 RepID=A0AAD5WX19_9PEZI|nr:hypothetical protein MKZ38_005816 [Zalerion maritima]
MSSNVLATKDANLLLASNGPANSSATGHEGKDTMTMEYHRQVLQSKMEEEKYEKPFVAACFVPSNPTTTTTATYSAPSSNPAESEEDEENYVLSSSSSPQMPPVIIPIPGRGSDADSGSNTGDTAAGGANNKKPNSRADIVLIRERQKQQYISPSDNIMSPCTAKLTALRTKQAGKAKPKSLFAQTSSKKLGGDALFGSKPSPKEPEN